MRLTPRDGLATLLVAAILVLYGDFLATGGAPLVDDVKGMAGVGMLLGTFAFLAVRRRPPVDPRSSLEAVLGPAVLAMGAVAVLAGETRAGPAVLAAFIAAVLGLWVVELLDHAGVISIEDRRRAQPRR
jgi:hypothetical protein